MATLDREALVWDLAGQEDYRLMHYPGCCEVGSESRSGFGACG